MAAMRHVRPRASSMDYANACQVLVELDARGLLSDQMTVVMDDDDDSILEFNWPFFGLECSFTSTLPHSVFFFFFLCGIA